MMTKADIELILEVTRDNDNERDAVKAFRVKIGREPAYKLHCVKS
jgi:hypothetical protein